MESHQSPAGNPTFATSAHPNRSSSGKRRRSDANDNRQRSRGNSSSSIGNDKIDALGRLLTRILRHMASKLNLDIRSDGYVKVQDLLKLDKTTSAKIPLRSHAIEDIKEQRFSLVEENGELLLRANQGHILTDYVDGVITGDRRLIIGGSGKVLATQSGDTIFIYFSGHGGLNVVEIPNNELLRKEDLQSAIKKKWMMKTFKTMIVFIDACHSGSMFNNFPNYKGIYAMTSAPDDNYSYAKYCGDDFCISTEFRDAWMT
ncbi:hypothetical protein OROMI_019311 [Orobanche minor]